MEQLTASALGYISPANIWIEGMAHCDRLTIWLLGMRWWAVIGWLCSPSRGRRNWHSDVHEISHRSVNSWTTTHVNVCLSFIDKWAFNNFLVWRFEVKCSSSPPNNMVTGRYTCIQHSIRMHLTNPQNQTIEMIWRWNNKRSSKSCNYQGRIKPHDC